MLTKFTNMMHRKLTVDWSKDMGELDLRSHSLGIGGINSMPPPKAVVEATAALKPRMVRIFLQEFFFIYPDHGVFDWVKMDAYMDAVHAMGGDIMASICIKPKPLYPEVDEKIYMPTDIKEWQAVIKAMVLRYSKEKPYVTYWSVANEMNIGENGGAPYLITNPDDFFEYYKITIAPILEALPDIKVGGPSAAAGCSNDMWDDGAIAFLERFTELCTINKVPLHFICWNAYSDNPQSHGGKGKIIRDNTDKYDPSIEIYMTELNVLINNDATLHEMAYDPKRAASLAATLLAFNENKSLTGSFQYHIYDQWHDPKEFASWYKITRYMSECWNDMPHRFGLIDLDGRKRPQYYMYQLLYKLIGRRVGLEGTDNTLTGIACGDDKILSVFLTNFNIEETPDSVTHIHFKDAPEGIYRLNMYRIDEESAKLIKNTNMDELEPEDSRIVYVHPDFHFDVYTPGDSVTLVQLVKA